MKVLVIDNYDSFTYNLVEYVSKVTLPDGTTPEITVLKNTVDLAAVRAVDPDAILISPGPGHPANDRDVGVSAPVLREVAPQVPTLGVCLGMEAAVSVYGGEVGTAPEPVHGKADPVAHDGRGIFEGIEPEFQGGRYHSLIALDVPAVFEVSARTEQDGESIPMAIRHREHPIVAVQFHPESVLTPVGHDLIEHFLLAA
ncbi:anthranilate synthase component II [Halodesulfurarchaeum sp. HSR-GB]|uniref:anthranilate synthase component II n=1 Tax=Halodesulfurarchaeum sp. HSR-GB TaxID=3074077 RepID=UPI0028549F5E|nr:anthranilate synthase component II [Halodesulfurarchaeum sp. HSR-GB]MDR5655702.1 anthranilate synthase component II [Halodesulfurarchaeum sp. HSR-GB]